MKKQGLLLIAGGMLALASCQNDANTGASDAQIDSMVNARVEELRMEMMMQNDSLINAMAVVKADSICGAKSTGSAGKTVKKTEPKKPNYGTNTPAPTTGSVEPSTPTNTGKKSGERGENTGKKGDQSQGVNTGKKRSN